MINRKTIQKIIATVAAFLFLFTASGQQQNRQHIFRHKTAKVFCGKYKGVLPCEACDSLIVELTLLYNKSTHSGNYIRNQIYKGTPKGDVTKSSNGLWIIEKGCPADSTATIVELNYNKPDRETFYLVQENGSLLPLDDQRLADISPFDCSMQKQ